MDSLCFFKASGLPKIATGTIPLSAPGLDSRPPPPSHVSSLGRRPAAAGVSVETPSDPGTSNYFARPFRFLWSSAAEKPIDELALREAFVTEEDEEEAVDLEGEGSQQKYENLDPGRRRGNWVLKILHIRSIWSEKKARGDGNGDPGDKDDHGLEEFDTDQGCCQCCGDDQDGVCGVGDYVELTDFDRATFSKFLKRVSLVEARLYAQMSYLGNLGYAISKIKPGNLLKYHGLRFVTSSLEKKELNGLNTEDKVKSKSSKTEEKQSSSESEILVKETDDRMDVEKKKRFGIQISASAAYQIAAAAASYVQSQTKNILPFASANTKVENVNEGVNANDTKCGKRSDITGSDIASFVATTSSVTSVVAAEEEMKQAVAKDLSSVHSSPCEWFICDVENAGTRLFVIQGSESLASWQANLLFEPIQFEGLDVLVHRGIYEAAKGIYKQMLPEVQAHLRSHGESARLRFTGHSLGGSLALLVNLMLLVRGEVRRSSLLPVITFGSPSIMCGGDHLLQKLGLPRSHVQSITMHRDIVPRAFSCNYPDLVAELLKAVNGNFRNHPCLKYQKSLYTPMGELLILQPDENYSPQHHLLPDGSGFYRLCGGADSDSSHILAGELRAAETAFLNSPHPLEILSDRSAYGSEGTIYRDHHMNSYLRSVRYVICQELNRLRKAKREQRRKLWWPLVSPNREAPMGIIFAPRPASGQKHQFIFSGIVRTGKESLRRISRFVASQHLHVLLLLIPARLLLLSAFTVVSSS